VALTFNQDQTAVISTKNVTFVDSLGAGLNVVSVSDLALPAASTQPDSQANTTEQALISLLMTLSDAQETTLSGALKKELGLLGII
jgi:hypothetical protein